MRDTSRGRGLPVRRILEGQHRHFNQWRTVEGRRRDPEDLGDVLDAAGVRIGRVTERDERLVQWVEVED